MKSLLIVDDDDFQVQENVKSVLNANLFWNNLSCSLNFFKPLGFATSYLEGDLVPYGAAYGVFLYFKLLYTNWGAKEPYVTNPSLKEYINEKLEKRFNILS